MSGRDTVVKKEQVLSWKSAVAKLLSTLNFFARAWVVGFALEPSEICRPADVRKPRDVAFNQNLHLMALSTQCENHVIVWRTCPK